MERFNVLQFLEEYEKFPCLWKKNNPDFKNRVKREQAEEQMLLVLGLSNVKELRQKIRSIRCTYNQEVAKIRKSMGNGSDAGDVYKPKLVWFSAADSFLRQNFEENDSESNVTLLHYYGGINMEVEAIDGSAPDPSQAQTSEVTTVVMPRPRVSRKKLGTSTRRLPRKKKVHDNSLGKAIKVLKRAAAQPKSTANEFRAFGQHVASQLQCLPIEKALKMQEEIQKLITTTRLKCIQSGNLYRSSTSSFDGETNFLSTTYSSGGTSDLSNSPEWDHQYNDKHASYE